MKQALLITAYKNPEHLNNLIDVFENDDNFSVYIHIDNKGTFTKEDIERLRSIRIVKYISTKYRVQWGSINHLKAFLLLCKEAVKESGVEYIHTITGHDYPIKSAAEITRFMEEHKGTLFMNADKLPFDGWIGGGLDRIIYYYPHDLINVRVPRNYKIKERIIEFQQKYKLERNFPKSFPSELYGGLVYWSIPTDAVQYILDFNKKNGSYLRRFRLTYCSEEIYFQSIIMNSPFREQVNKNNLRFMVWEKRNGNNPANLDESDFENIESSDALFARKFELPVSLGLYQKIKDKIKKSNQEKYLPL